MSKVSARETGCCGASFERNHISIIALATVALPFVLLYTLVRPLIALTQAARPRPARWVSILRSLYDANLRIIRDTHLLPRARCAVSGRLFSISPALGGFSFKAFNLTLLALLWLVPVTLVTIVWRMVF